MLYHVSRKGLNISLVVFFGRGGGREGECINIGGGVDLKYNI